MARSAAAAFLEQAYSHMDFLPGVTDTVIISLNKARDRVIERLWTKNTKLARKAQDVTSYIERKRLKFADVEANIRHHRLTEALRKKQELEQKLTLVSQSILKMGHEENERFSPKPDLRDKKTRRQFFSEESARRREASEFAKRLRKEQLETVQNQRVRRKEEQDRLQNESMEQMKRKEELTLKQREAKEKREFDIKESIRKRKEMMESKRKLEAAEKERIREQKYVSEKLIQDFHKRVLLPLEEQKAEILNKNKMMHQPISKEEIEAHARRHDEEIRQMQAVRQEERMEKVPDSWVMKTSRFTQSILLQARKDTEEKEAQEAEKRMLQDKRKRYAALVKSLFIPAVDPLKQKELEVLKERLKSHPITSKSSRDEPTSPWKPHRFKPNSMVPPPKERKSPNSSDYLAEKRHIRANYEQETLPEERLKDFDWSTELEKDGISQAEKAKIVQMKAEKLTLDAKRKELLLSHVSPANTKALEVGEKMDEAIIGSIKAKLSIIEAS